MFLSLWGQILIHTLGVLSACGLAVEIVYRLCFIIMGERWGRLFFGVSSLVGTPVHEAGHALMCLLFAHRIERIRLFSTKRESAVVEHSYRKRNLYAMFGNFWIGLGPLFTGLLVVLLCLFFAFPSALSAWYESMLSTLSQAAEGESVTLLAGECVRTLLWGLRSDVTRSVWVRIAALLIMVSVSLHVRLSAEDIWGMMTGLPYFLALTALGAFLLGEASQAVRASVTAWLRQLSYGMVSLFSLILLLGLLQLIFAILLRILIWLFRVPSGRQ